jgi:excisionase family DNA binding protein
MNEKLNDLPEVLSPEEVATYLRRTPVWVRKMCRRGELQARKIGGNWYIPREALRMQTA